MTPPKKEHDPYGSKYLRKCFGYDFGYSVASQEVFGSIGDDKPLDLEEWWENEEQILGSHPIIRDLSFLGVPQIK